MDQTASVTVTVTVNGESKTFTASTESDGDIRRVASGLAGSLRWDVDEWLQTEPRQPGALRSQDLAGLGNL